MNRSEFIEKFFDEFFGQVMDAVLSQRTGGELSAWSRLAAQKVKVRLGICYDALKPPVAPEAKPNGTPAQQQGVKK